MKWAVVFAALAASPAAACPTSADLDDGVIVETGRQPTPSIMSLKRLGADLYWRGQHSRLFPDQWQVFSHEGFFDLYKQRASGSGKQIRTYEAPPKDMAAALVDGGSFSMTSTWGDPTGEKAWVGDVVVTVTAVEPFTVNGCSYDRLLVKEDGTIKRPNGEIRAYRRSGYYLPELRFHHTGVYPILDVRRAGRRDDLISKKKLRQMVKDIPQVAAIASDYDLTQ